MLALAVTLAALSLDALFGEPRIAHPTVLFGKYAGWLEQHLNRQRITAGLLAWCLAVLPFLLLVVYLETIVATQTTAIFLLHSLVVYWAVGRRSLREHAFAVAEPLAHGDLKSARNAVAMIVSRDTAELSEQEIARAATESVLENGADATLNAVFWYLVAGLPGIVLYRLSNTLDAMWGYRNARFEQFGKAAARIDDGLNYIPARFTALAYALAGKTALAFKCWREQAARWKSPNAGPVMAAGAGAINTSLGGVACYHGQTVEQPTLGPALNTDTMPDAAKIIQACQLLDRALLIWLACTGLIITAGWL